MHHIYTINNKKQFIWSKYISCCAFASSQCLRIVRPRSIDEPREIWYNSRRMDKIGKAR